eukprot:COSAG01_NODE_7300_length_3262_cov_2.087891_2_plen_339_part_00
MGADPGGWLAHAARRARQSHARLTEAEQDAERTLLVTGIGHEYALQVAVEAALAPLSASQVHLSLEPLASPLQEEQRNRGKQRGGGGASAWVLLTFGSAQMAKRFCQKQEREAALCTVPWRFESLDAYRLKELRTALRYESKVMAADPQRDPDRLGAVREILSSGVRVAELYRYRAEPEAKVAAQAKAAERRLVELTAGAEGLSAREERERAAEQEWRRVQRAAQVGGVAGPCTQAPPPIHLRGGRAAGVAAVSPTERVACADCVVFLCCRESASTVRGRSFWATRQLSAPGPVSGARRWTTWCARAAEARHRRSHPPTTRAERQQEATVLRESKTAT